MAVAGAWRLLVLLGVATAALGSTAAAAHLIERGTPLSQLAAASGPAVAGRIETLPDGSAAGVGLVVEKVVVGAIFAERLRFESIGLHPPAYRPGERVLVFLRAGAGGFTSDQSEHERIDLPEAEAEREALFDAVRDYASLRTVREPELRRERLRDRSLVHLESRSARVRRDALGDLMALSERRGLDAAEIRRLQTLAGDGDAPADLAPGAVALLASTPSSEAGGALRALVSGDGPIRARVLAAHALGRRGDAGSVPVLAAALDDPEPALRRVARHALGELDTPAAREALRMDAERSRSGSGDA